MKKRFLFPIAVIGALFACPPSSAQLGTDPAVVGAMTYCALRSQGLDNAKASRRAYESLASVTDLATFFVHRQNIHTRMVYMAQQQCPQYFR